MFSSIWQYQIVSSTTVFFKTLAYFFVGNVTLKMLGNFTAISVSSCIVWYCCYRAYVENAIVVAD